MIRRIVLALSLVVACMGMDCEGNLEGLQAKLWSQLQANPQGTGYNPVDTAFALLPLRKWAVNVGELANSSPVIAPDGTIYVGTIAGDLVGVSPAGVETHRRSIGEPIWSSPAADSDGNIWFISQHVQDDSITSHLNKYLPDSNTVLTAGGPIFKSSASPKLWRDHVFVATANKVLIYDRSTMELFVESSATDCFRLACGGSDLGDLPLWERLLLCFGTFYIVPAIDFDVCPGTGFTPGEGGPGSACAGVSMTSPSVAIIDSPNVVDPDRPIVVMATAQCLTAFQFRPRANEDFRFRRLWETPLVAVDCNFDRIAPATPVISPGGAIIVGDSRGDVRAFDLNDGHQLWKYDGRDGEPIQNPPVMGLRQIYVPARGYLITLDSDGSEVSKTPLQQSYACAQVNGAALSLNHIFVTTNQGIHTFGLFPETDESSFEGALNSETHLGGTVPALGKDGTVYVATPNGYLHAFGAGPAAIAFAVHSIAWASPADGDSISYRAGQMLEVALGGPGTAGFTGDVAIFSDVDGKLCQWAVDRASEASCATAKPLTLGPHTLTAFATEQSGGVRSSQINVDVVNHSPTVEIDQPLDGASVFANSEQSFIATISDVDETIPIARIVWASNRDGELGTGASIDVFLSVGTHAISCTATDELGAAATDSVTIFVNEQIE